MPRFAVLAFLGIVTLAPAAVAAESEKKVDLAVLYVGNAASARGTAYADFLRQHFRHARATERKRFDPRRAADFDVVLLDWSQSDKDDKEKSPLGPMEAWEKPTVLLGSAGLLLASPWEIHGAIG